MMQYNTQNCRMDLIHPTISSDLEFPGIQSDQIRHIIRQSSRSEKENATVRVTRRKSEGLPRPGKWITLIGSEGGRRGKNDQTHMHRHLHRRLQSSWRKVQERKRSQVVPAIYLISLLLLTTTTTFTFTSLRFTSHHTTRHHFTSHHIPLVI